VRLSARRSVGVLRGFDVELADGEVFDAKVFELGIVDAQLAYGQRGDREGSDGDGSDGERAYGHCAEGGCTEGDAFRFGGGSELLVCHDGIVFRRSLDASVGVKLSYPAICRGMAQSMTDIEINSRVLDAAYKPFPTFETWLSKTSIDTVRWERYNASLNAREISPEISVRAKEIAKRAAALDTGAIEGLYEVNYGFTYSVAAMTSAWEVELAKKGEQVRPLFEAQLQAYDYVLTLATRAEQFSEAAIRELHAVVCAAQDTYSVTTAVGPQQQPLPKGQYKAQPNHVWTRNQENHSYAPVDVTPQEMARLVQELRSDLFQSAHPVTQAAYAHYALVVVHPFADGNGRVARALASAFTYRAVSMPIVILSEQKIPYLDALGDADKGDYQGFVDFMLARSLETIKLIEEEVLLADTQSSEKSLSMIDSLYITKGGYSQDQVDEAGKRLFAAFVGELQKLISTRSRANLTGEVSYVGGGNLTVGPGYRSPISGNALMQIGLRTSAPASAQVNRRYLLAVPTNAGGEDDIEIRRQQSEATFAVRAEEVVSGISSGALIRTQIFAERVFGEMLEELVPLAKKSLAGPDILAILRKGAPGSDA
jgi:Fic family protein